MEITQGKIWAAAKTLAGFNGDAWVFEPPKMDGITRSGTDQSVYLREAEAILFSAENAPETPVSDT
jgi:hypothetical protein